MTNIETLKSLQTRIREAKGASRELDVEIDVLFRGGRLVGNWRRNDKNEWFNIPNYTTDPEGLGACVALMRETFPGARWGVHPDTRRFSIDNETRCTVVAKLANDCLTFLDAICSALIAQMEAREGVK